MAKEMKFTIPAPNIQLMRVKIVGTAPLIYNRWTEKAKKMMLDKQMKKAVAGKREAKDPKQLVEDSYYRDSKGKIAFPALNIKMALVSSARSVEGLPMTLLRGAVFVAGDADGMIPVKYEKKEGRSDTVRVGMGVADIRFRGQLTGWSMEFIIKFNADLLSAEQVLNLLQIAGFSSGLGEWRPEKNGVSGTFEVSQGK